MLGVGVGINAIQKNGASGGTPQNRVVDSNGNPVVDSNGNQVVRS
jgi:hypothetical protein